jgi:hypothetical protein
LRSSRHQAGSRRARVSPRGGFSGCCWPRSACPTSCSADRAADPGVVRPRISRSARLPPVRAVEPGLLAALAFIHSPLSPDDDRAPGPPLVGRAWRLHAVVLAPRRGLAARPQDSADRPRRRTIGGCGARDCRRDRLGASSPWLALPAMGPGCCLP